MIGITPLDYERYAVLVSPLLVHGPVSDKPLSNGGGPTPITRTSATSQRQQSGTELSGDTIQSNIDRDQKPRVRYRASIPFKHPDPETGRGQKVDLFA